MRPLREALVVFALTSAVIVVLWNLAAWLPFLDRNLQVFVALLFLGVPVFLARREPQDLRAFGFDHRPLGLSLALGLGVPAIVFPLFLLVFVGFYTFVCGLDIHSGWHQLAPPGFCRQFVGWASLADWTWSAEGNGWVGALSQVVVVALPEELFFRGYLQLRLEQAFVPGRRLWGAPVGRALVLSAALFALSHVVVDLDPRRFVVFFPGLLFGWLRARTGSIFAGTLVHALANIYIDALQATFLRG